MSSDYFIGSVPTTPTTAYSNAELDKLYKDDRMETIIDSAIISRENSGEMLVSSKLQEDHDLSSTLLDDPIMLGTAGDVVVGTSFFYYIRAQYCSMFLNIICQVDSFSFFLCT